MEQKPFFTKLEYVTLLRRKRGMDYAYGWLMMAYALPPVPEEQEREIIQNDWELLNSLPDYEAVGPQ
jgi:hypothetical protein